MNRNLDETQFQRSHLKAETRQLPLRICLMFPRPPDIMNTSHVTHFDI